MINKAKKPVVIKPFIFRLQEMAIIMGDRDRALTAVPTWAHDDLDQAIVFDGDISPLCKPLPTDHVMFDPHRIGCGKVKMIFYDLTGWLVDHESATCYPIGDKYVIIVVPCFASRDGARRMFCLTYDIEQELVYIVTVQPGATYPKLEEKA